MENAIATYGFNFGDNAINYLLLHQQQTITWRYRMLWIQKPEATPGEEQTEATNAQAETSEQDAQPDQQETAS